MAEQTNPQEVAGKVDALLEDIEQHAEPAMLAAAEGLVKLLMQFYGSGLEQIVTVARAAGGETLVNRLAADPLVGGLLALHDLHPVEMRIRAKHAVETARRKLGSHGEGVELLGVDGHGMIRVRIAGSGCGTETIRSVVEAAIGEVAPEAAGIDFVSAPAGPPVLQLSAPPSRSAP